MLPALRWVILHEIVSLIIQNWNKMPLTAFWGLSRKFSFEVAVRRHFPVVTYLIGLPLMIANFWTRWLLLVDNFLKSHQIETKNSTIQGLLQKFFFWNCCVTCCAANLIWIILLENGCPWWPNSFTHTTMKHEARKNVIK